jgi:hypothetical protein
MTHKKHEIAVFIENEEMLKEARELLEKYKQIITPHSNSFLFKGGENPYLKLSYSYRWYLSDNEKAREFITLPQLEEILKNQ